MSEIEVEDRDIEVDEVKELLEDLLARVEGEIEDSDNEVAAGKELLEGLVAGVNRVVVVGLVLAVLILVFGLAWMRSSSDANWKQVKLQEAAVESLEQIETVILYQNCAGSKKD